MTLLLLLYYYLFCTAPCCSHERIQDVGACLLLDREKSLLIKVSSLFESRLYVFRVFMTGIIQDLMIRSWPRDVHYLIASLSKASSKIIFATSVWYLDRECYLVYDLLFCIILRPRKPACTSCWNRGMGVDPTLLPPPLTLTPRRSRAPINA